MAEEYLKISRIANNDQTICFSTVGRSTEENLITEMLEKFKGVNDGVNSEANTNNNRSNTTNVKPPTLELPRFDEKIAEWTTFCDLLIAAIHNN